jgi:hypothetical protein
MDRLGEPIVPLPMARKDVPPVTEWRSTWVTSSLQTLRARGLFDRYVAALPEEYRDVLPLTVAGVWMPIATARAHYQACNALGFSQSEARDLGLAVGERAQGTILRTAVALVKGVGVDGWSLMNHVPRIWERGARGGAVGVYKVGPKEANVEVLGCELFDVPYFRAAYHGVVLGVLRLVTQQAYAHEKAGSVSSDFVVRLQWV